MIDMFRRRLSYANIAATVALVLGATGLAAAASSPSQNVIRACASKSSGTLRMLTGKQKCSKHRERAVSWGQQGPPGAPGPAGKDGAPGPAGTALAYAFVNADGTVNASRSKGITAANVAKGPVGNGIYCFKGFEGGTPKSIITTLNADGFSAGAISTQVYDGTFAEGSVCPVNSQFAVYETDKEGAFPSNKPFWILLN
jgi:hypothetical protein